MAITITFDNIIYKLQKNGGTSLYWTELTSRVRNNSDFQVKSIDGNRKARLFPVFSDSDIFHSSHFRTSYGGNSKVISTIHDLTYEKRILSTSPLGNTVNIWQRRNAIKYADAIICISESTKKEMLDFYPESFEKLIYVIHHGCSFSRSQIININITKRIPLILEKSSKFVLYVGTRNSYKNFISAVIGFATSSLPKSGFSLICTGTNFSEEETNMIRKLGVINKVMVLNQATHDELSYLYQNTFALIYPSIHEGFGLPPLEAMNSGAPVIAANASSIPEVVSEAGILINEIEDPQNIKNALETLLDDKVRNSYIVKGIERAKIFTWEESARQHMKVYKDVSQL